MGRPRRADGSMVRYTWGLLYKNDKTVAFFNMKKEEAVQKAEQHPDTFIAMPVCTRRYHPAKRGIGSVQC